MMLHNFLVLLHYNVHSQMKHLKKKTFAFALILFNGNVNALKLK